MDKQTEFLTAKQLIENYNNSLSRQERENIERIRKETEKHVALLFDEDQYDYR